MVITYPHMQARLGDDCNSWDLTPQRNTMHPSKDAPHLANHRLPPISTTFGPIQNETFVIGPSTEPSFPIMPRAPFDGSPSTRSGKQSSALLTPHLQTRSESMLTNCLLDLRGQTSQTSKKCHLLCHCPCQMTRCQEMIDKE